MIYSAPRIRGVIRPALCVDLKIAGAIATSIVFHYCYSIWYYTAIFQTLKKSTEMYSKLSCSCCY